MDEINKIPGSLGWTSTSAKDEYVTVACWLFESGVEPVAVLAALQRLYEAALKDDQHYAASAQRLNRR